MIDPVVTVDGHAYDRAAIEHWFSRGNLTSPVTNKILPSLGLSGEGSLRRAIEEYMHSVRPELARRELERRSLETVADRLQAAWVCERERASLAKTALVDADAAMAEAEEALARGLARAKERAMEVVDEETLSVPSEFESARNAGLALLDAEAAMAEAEGALARGRARACARAEKGAKEATESPAAATKEAATRATAAPRPSSNRAAPLPWPRYGLGAASLGGALYVCGGGDGTNLVASFARLEGGVGAAGGFAAAAASWAVLAPMRRPRASLGLAVLAGRLYACGGLDSLRRGTALALAERFDPAKGTWESVAPMTARRCAPGLAALDAGRLLACGGRSDRGLLLASAELYDVQADVWRPIAPMRAARYQLGVAGIGGASTGLMACGGFGPLPDKAFTGAVGAVELYVPGAVSWRRLAPLRVPRYAFGVTALRGAVFACGGCIGDGVKCLRCVERYDVATGLWEAVADMSAPRAYFGVAAVGDAVYIFGGHRSGEVLSDVERLVLA